MIIVREIQTGRVVYRRPDTAQVVLGEDGLTIDGLFDPGCTLETCEVDQDEATAAEVLPGQLAAAEAHYNRVAQLEIPWDFGDIEGKDDHGVSTGPAGVQTLQMRVDPLNGKDDPKNWLAALSGAQLAIMLDASDPMQPLKTTANIWVQTTAFQVAQVLALGDGPTRLSVLQVGRKRLERFGQIKAALVAAAEAEGATAADVLAVDVTDYPD